MLPDPTVLGPLLAYYGGDPLDRRPPSRALRRRWRRSRRPARSRPTGSSTTRPTSAPSVSTRRTWRRRPQLLGDHPPRTAVALGDPRIASRARSSRRRRACRWASCRTPAGRSKAVLAREMCQVGDGPHVAMRCRRRQRRRRRRQARPGDLRPRPRPLRRASTAAGSPTSATRSRWTSRRRARPGLHPILVDPYDDHPDRRLRTDPLAHRTRRRTRAA